MFTGLIETVGVVSLLEPAASGFRFRVRTALAPELKPGDSVAVNGCCLTVTAVENGEMRADIGPETVRATTLGLLQRDQPVNLERAMRGDARFGGHFVQGHVDGIGHIGEIREDGDARWVSVRFTASLERYVIAKGSIAIDGISLTVARLAPGQLDVMIVPFTWQQTNLSWLRPGDAVNLECDMIGKYIARAVDLFRTT
jgi:riboflavin synthase